MNRFLWTVLLGLVLTALFSMVVATPSEAARNVRVVQVREGDYEILPSKSSSYAMDVTGGGQASKETLIELYERNGTDAQVFTIQRVSGEWYRIIHKRTGYVVNVAGGHDRNAEDIQIYKDDGTDSCYWRFLDAGDGSCIIQSKLGGGRVLDLSNNKTRNGTRIQLWDFHTNQAARWVLSSVSRRNNGSSNRRVTHYDDDEDDDDYHGGYGRHRRGGYEDDDDDYRGGYGRHRHGGYDDDDDDYHGGYHRRGEHSRW